MDELSVCLLVTDFDSATGGVQRNSRLLLREFNQRGIETFVCTRNYHSLAVNEIADGTHIHRSRVFGSSRAVNGIVYLIETLVWLIKNRRKYDVVHCQQLYGSTMAACLAQYVTGKPVVTRITLSGETGEAAATREMPLASIRSRLIRCVARWVVLTGEMKLEIQSLGIPAERIRIIYNATNIPSETAYKDSQEIRRRLGLDYKKIGLFSGRLSEEKNVDVLITAWKSVVEVHPDAHLILLGSGGEYRNVEDELKNLCNDLGLDDNIHFKGHVSNAIDYMLASDLFILPSSAEGMSNSLVEGFAAGTAIVASDIPANTELCKDGVNSLLVPVRDATSLADAILKIFGSPSFSQKIAEAARALAEKNLSIDKMVESYLACYGDAIADAK